MEYLAFKSLRSRGEALVSPQQGSEWGYVPFLGALRPALYAAPGDVESGNGIFASDYAEALSYGKDVYLVAPLPDPDGRVDVVVGTRGWRASAAVVVAGPFARGDARPHETIVAAWRQGYRQVSGILAAAATMVGDTDTLAAALQDPDADVRAEAVCALGRIGPAASPTIPALTAALQDPDECVRKSASWALGRIG